MDIICRHKRNVQLLTHAQERRVDCPLLRNPMILKLKEIVALPKAVQVL